VKLNDISTFVSKRDGFNAPVWVGETGESSETIYWATTQYFEQNNIGWSLWPYKKINAGNCVYSAKAPEGWSAITGYTRGGEKPSADVAEKAFNGLLQNIQFKNCDYHPDVVQSLFRLVPGKVEAENYGHLGLNKSYFVKTSENSKLYRKSEPVPVMALQGTTNGQRRGGSGQAIKLSADEWTAYNFQSKTAQTCGLSLKVKAETTPCTLQVTVCDKSQSLTVTNLDWAEIRLNPVAVPKGAGTLKYAVKEGTIDVDWAQFQASDK
jgi:endoglucanase